LKFFLAALLALVTVALIAQLVRTTRSDEVVIACAATGLEFELCKSGSQAWQKRSGHRVRVLSAPNNSTERLGLFMQLLASQSPDVDVFTIDTTWAGMIGDFFVDLSAQAAPDDFPAFAENNTLDGRLVARPWYIDAGLLYYRSDLLDKYGQSVPRTWEELTRSARLIQDGERAIGQKELWGYVFQARAYEGLTCNALEWLSGGGLVGADGTLRVRDPELVHALELARGWIGTISPPGVLNYTEEEARGVFQSGNAVFLRSWPYVLKLAGSPTSKIRGKFGAAPVPGGAAVLGGWSLAVSKFSRHIETASDLVAYLASPEEQKRRALAGGFYPTHRDLYRDEDLRRENPLLTEFYEIFSRARPRPSRVFGPQYNRVSAEFWEAVHETLAGNGDAERNLARLEPRLRLITNGERMK
jgi:trehalose/maltose transport system substrate-binding protein